MALTEKGLKKEIWPASKSKPYKGPSVGKKGKLIRTANGRYTVGPADEGSDLRTADQPGWKKEKDEKDGPSKWERFKGGAGAVGGGIKDKASKLKDYLSGDSKEKLTGWPVRIGAAAAFIVGFIFVNFWIALGIALGILLLAVLRKKLPRLYKFLYVSFFIIVCIVLFTWFTRTGAGQSILPGEGSGGSSYSLTVIRAKVDRAIFCNVVAPGTCIEETRIGEQGGIDFSSLRTAQTVYLEGDPVEIAGYVYGTSWSSEWGAKGPDIEDVDVSVDIDWNEDFLGEGWICQQPESANSDFYCYFEDGVTKAAALRSNNEFCGINFKVLREDAGGTMDCRANANLYYTFSNSGYRRLFFSLDPAHVDLSSLDESKVFFSTGGPLKFTIGSDRNWNEIIKPDSAFKKSLPIRIALDESISETRHKITLKSAKFTIASKEGIDIECCEGCEKTKDYKGTYCTKTKFEPNVLGGRTHNEEVEFSMRLVFSDAFVNALKGKEKETLDIIGDLEYEIVTTRGVTVKVRYKLTADDVALRNTEQTPESHGCGYDATCVQKVLSKSGKCTSPKCVDIYTENKGKQLRCFCDTAGVEKDVWCCNAISCGFALTSDSLSELEGACGKAI